MMIAVMTTKGHNVAAYQTSVVEKGNIPEAAPAQEV
jgi:hypothetical protein